MKLQLMREESLVINKELEPLWYGGINHEIGRAHV